MKVSPEEFFEKYGQTKTRAHEIAEKIKGNYDGYKLLCSFEGNNATIYFESRNYLDNRRKNIGTLCYNPETENITYSKYGFVSSAHEFHKADSIGICYEILKYLIPAGDCILITEKSESSIKKYFISARKAHTFATPANFYNFKNQGYEKQVLIPKSEFKVTEIETKKKRGKRK